MRRWQSRVKRAGQGEHTISIRKGGYPTFEETFDVEAGAIINVKLQRVEQAGGQSG
ncbi:MAG: hypothetical protein O7A04_02775 [Acidobacteria bacterium]|nr:hypothetical protein [Acidobacteriota bacterium]